MSWIIPILIRKKNGLIGGSNIIRYNPADESLAEHGEKMACIRAHAQRRKPFAELHDDLRGPRRATILRVG